MPAECRVPEPEQEGRHRGRQQRHREGRQPAPLPGTAQGEHRRHRLQRPGRRLVERDRLLERRQQRTQQLGQDREQRDAVGQRDAGAPGCVEPPVDQQVRCGRPRLREPGLREEIQLAEHVLAEVRPRRRPGRQAADQRPMREHPQHQGDADRERRQVAGRCTSECRPEGPRRLQGGLHEPTILVPAQACDGPRALAIRSGSRGRLGVVRSGAKRRALIASSGLPPGSLRPPTRHFHAPLICSDRRLGHRCRAGRGSGTWMPASAPAAQKSSERSSPP